MIAAAAGSALVAGSCIFAGPALLLRGDWRWRRPRAALLTWMAMLLGGCLVLLVGLVALLAAAVARPHHGPLETTAIFVGGWAALVVAGALAALVAAQAEPVLGASRRARWQVELLAARSRQRTRVAGVEVVTVDSDAPVAAGCRGHTGDRVVLSTPVQRALGAEGLRAVVEHERAHLQQRHGLILRLAQVNVACFPALPSARRLDREARVLTELAADDVAASRCGAGAVARALRAVDAVRPETGLALRAHRVEALAAPDRRRFARRAVPAPLGVRGRR